MSEQTFINEFGFHELKVKPDLKTLKEYYSSKYYQQSQGDYNISYSSREIEFFKNRIEQKLLAIHQIETFRSKANSLLDIGCGEGHTLSFFKDKGWKVAGVDYSEFGCKNQNPECLPHLIVGDIEEVLNDLVRQGNKYDILWLDNVLEHSLAPLQLLQICHNLMETNGVLVIEVPNDFSVLQEHLLATKKVTTPYWIAIPDHISYFNAEGLNNLAIAAGLKNEVLLCDYPIDFALLNPDTNYVADKSRGKKVHEARLEIEQMLQTISPSKTLDLLKSLASLGLGRQIISIYSRIQ